MKFAAAAASLFVVAIANALSSVDASGVVEEWAVHPTKLPEPISDQTATANPETGILYIVGGCNSPVGNERAPWDDQLFYCASITDAMYTFDPVSGVIDTESVPDAPRPRYRHAAAYVNGRIWLVGGRDAEDNIIREVDIYDIATNKWLTTTLSIPETFAKSDCSAFAAEDDYISVVGGYNANYDGTTTNFAINTKASLEYGELLINPRQDMAVGRGDTHAVYVDGYAYVIGGFTHENFWCEALPTVERYDYKSDSWTTLSPLTFGRGDKAVTVIDKSIYVIGGESNTDCSQDPAQRTSPSTEVEVLDTRGGLEAKWTEEIANIPSDHFRFPAASIGNTIYTFGGQAYYKSSCDCFTTRDTIMYYTVENTPRLTGGAIAGIAIGCTAAVIIVIVLAFILLKKKNEDSKEMPDVEPKSEYVS